MADLEVIYDPNKELACIVHVDSRMGWGPAMIGPQAGNLLQAFLDTTPFDVSELDSYAATAAFTSFLERAGIKITPETTPDNQGSMDYTTTAAMDNGNALAEAEAVASSDVPAPQPADTDTPPDQSTAPTVVGCPNCQGTGSVRFGDDEAPQTCGMCNGSGKVTVQAPA